MLPETPPEPDPLRGPAARPAAIGPVPTFPAASRPAIRVHNSFPPVVERHAARGRDLTLDHLAGRGDAFQLDGRAAAAGGRVTPRNVRSVSNARARLW